MNQAFSRTKKLTFSAIVIAIYYVVMYLTQSFAFGSYQIRVATSLYSLSYLFPFLVLPLGAANFLSNLLGGLGIFDVVGGGLAGVVTAGANYLIRRFNLPALLIIPVIIAGPGLIVPIWLSPILNIPYAPLALSLCIGQTAPAILGYILVKVLKRAGMDEYKR